MSALDDKLLKLRDDWTKCLEAIVDARYDIDKINLVAKLAIMDSVDVNATNKEFGSMLKAFDEKRFGSDVVLSFLKKLCGRIFPANAEWRKHVCCVDIAGSWSNNFADEAECDCSNVTFTFADMASSKGFSVKVPVKENVWYDFARMPENDMGKYVLYCTLDRHVFINTRFETLSNFTKSAVKVAEACSHQVLADAVDAFMCGKLDDELKDAAKLDVVLKRRQKATRKIWSISNMSFAKVHYYDEMSPTAELFGPLDDFFENSSYEESNAEPCINNMFTD